EVHGQDDAGDKSAWPPEVCFKIKSVGNVQPSPDGKRVVYTVTKTILEATSASEETRIEVASADGTGAAALVKGDKKPSNPQWSPDGEWVAYLADNNLHRVRPDGTAAEAVTQGLAVHAFKWSPDGAAIAFLEFPAAKKQPAGVAQVVDVDIFLGAQPGKARLSVVP